MTDKEIKEIFHAHDVKISKDALQLVKDRLRREVNLMAERCKSGNYKMLRTEHFWVAIGDMSKYGNFQSKRD